MREERIRPGNPDESLIEAQSHIAEENEVQEIPFLSDIGLATTYHCQASCLHCIVEASPKRKEFIPLREVHNWLDQISSYHNGQIKAVALTGGEPFSDLEHLTSIARKASSVGLLITAVSNAHWATSYEVALNILKSLPDICVFTFSTDKYHQRVIPLERIKNAVNAAQKLGRSYSIAVCTGSYMEEETQKTLDYLSDLTPPETINNAYIFPVGRARRQVKNTRYPSSTDPPRAACSMAHAPVILPNGDIVACFGPIVAIKSEHPLLLGNLYRQSLFDILDQAEMNTILHAIRIWGPYKIIEMMKKDGLKKDLPDEYVTGSICCTCYDIFNRLQDREELRTALNKLKEDKEFQEMVSYGRVYYLQETHMAEMMSEGR